jgi:hypothetical protein
VRATATVDPDDEVVLDFDAQGKISGAFTRREMKAQTARFRAQIELLAKEHQSVADEVSKLAAVQQKLAAAHHSERVHAEVLGSLNVTLSSLMSSYRAAVLSAQAHGLVIMTQADDLTVDDMAEHAIWVEDGFTGEASLPALDMADEEGDDAWSAEKAWKEAQQQEEALKAAAQRKEEEEEATRRAQEKDAAKLLKRSSSVSIASLHSSSSGKSGPGSPRDSLVRATSLLPALSSPTAVVTDAPSVAVSPPALSAAEVIARALAAKEDEEEEQDETRVEKERWEEGMRETFEKQAEADGTYAPKLARYEAKQTKLRAQLEAMRLQTSTEAELLRDKLATFSSKIAAVLAGKEQAFQALLREKEPNWTAEWEANRPQRQERRNAARVEAATLEAAATKAETARLKREKRVAANSHVIGSSGGRNKSGSFASLGVRNANKASSSVLSPPASNLSSPRSSTRGTVPAAAQKQALAAQSTATTVAQPAATIATPVAGAKSTKKLTPRKEPSVSAKSAPSKPIRPRAAPPSTVSVVPQLSHERLLLSTRTAVADIAEGDDADVDGSTEGVTPQRGNSDAQAGATTVRSTGTTTTMVAHTNSSTGALPAIPIELSPLHRTHVQLHQSKSSLAHRVAELKLLVAQRRAEALARMPTGDRTPTHEAALQRALLGAKREMDTWSALMQCPSPHPWPSPSSSALVPSAPSAEKLSDVNGAAVLPSLSDLPSPTSVAVLWLPSSPMRKEQRATADLDA